MAFYFHILTTMHGQNHIKFLLSNSVCGSYIKSVNRNVHFVVPFDDVNWPANRVSHEKFWTDADHIDSCVSYSASVYTGVSSYMLG
jgi:hypothetical protein